MATMTNEERLLYLAEIPPVKILDTRTLHSEGKKTLHGTKTMGVVLSNKDFNSIMEFLANYRGWAFHSKLNENGEYVKLPEIMECTEEDLEKIKQDYLSRMEGKEGERIGYSTQVLSWSPFGKVLFRIFQVHPYFEAFMFCSSSFAEKNFIKTDPKEFISNWVGEIKKTAAGVMQMTVTSYEESTENFEVKFRWGHPDGSEIVGWQEVSEKEPKKEEPK